MKQFKETDEFGTSMIKLMPEDIGKYEDDDIIRTKGHHHIQFIQKGTADTMQYDVMKKHWDRMIIVLVDLNFNVGDTIVNAWTGSKLIATEGDIKTKRMTHFKILGQASNAVKGMLRNGFVSDGCQIDAQRMPLHECAIPNHENDVTGYWFKIKCPCCGEYK